MSKTNYEEISFDPSFMEINDGEAKDEKKEELDLFNEDPLGINKSKEDIKKESDDIENTEGVKDNDDKNVPSPEDIKDESSNLFSVVLGHDLMEKGILSSFEKDEVARIEKEDGEAAAIEYMIQKQTELINNELKETYDSGYKEYLQMLQGGVPKEEVVGIQQLEKFSSSLKEIDLKGEEEASVQARKDALTLHYRLSTKFSDEKIQKMVDKMYDEGTDVEEIDDALASIEAYIGDEKKQAIVRAEQAKADSQKAQEKWLSDLKGYVEKTDEYFKGDKVTKQVKDNMIKLLTTPVKLDDGQVVSSIWAERAKDPIKFDAGIAYLKTIGYFDNKPLDKFIKNAETKTASKLQEFLNESKGRSYMSGMRRDNNDIKPSNDIDKALFGDA